MLDVIGTIKGSSGCVPFIFEEFVVLLVINVHGLLSDSIDPKRLLYTL